MHIPGSHSNANPHGRDIIIEARETNRLLRISEMNPSYLPLRYPVLYPYGEQGWHAELYSLRVELYSRSWFLINISNPFTNRPISAKAITQRAFYAYDSELA